MKRSFITSGVILAASFTLTNCALEIVDSDENFNEGIPFEICAGSVDTKTTLDGLATKWASGDAINLFHAATGTEEYVSDGSFTIADADLESGRFTGTLASALEDDAYDWYAFYPYSKYITTPANTTTGYITVGGKSQTQNGLNSMAHLAGSACPLYGVATNVPSDEIPSIQMNHLTSIIEIKVTNNSGEPLTVSNVTFTAPVDIVGTYYVDFVSNPVVYTGSGASYISSTASLNVMNPEAIANGASAAFYIAVKPFEASSGDELKISVNGYEKSVTIPEEKSVAFSAGKIKTLSFKYDTAQIKIASGSYVLAVKDKDTYYAMSSKSNGTSNRRDYFILTDYSGQTEYHTPYSEIVWSVDAKENGIVLSNGDLYISAAKNTANMVSDISDASTLSFTPLMDNTFILSYNLGETDGIRYLAKNSTSGFAFYASSTGINSIIFIPAVYDNTPIIEVEEDDMTKDVGAEGGIVEIPYSIRNLQDGIDLNVSSSKEWAVPSVAGGKISVEVATNDQAEERTATITLSYTGADNVSISINQAAAGTKLPEYTILDLTTKLAGQSGYSSITTYGDWNIVNGANNNNGWAYFKMGGKSETLKTANPCYIYITKPVSHTVAEVQVHIPQGSLSKNGMSVNEWGLYVYYDKDMTQLAEYVSGGTITSSEGTFVFHPNGNYSWDARCYYKVSWNLSNTTTSNGIVLVDKITLSDTIE